MIAYYAVCESEDGQRNFVKSRGINGLMEEGNRVTFTDPMGQQYVACRVVAAYSTWEGDGGLDEIAPFIGMLSPVCEAEEIFRSAYRKEEANE